MIQLKPLHDRVVIKRVDGAEKSRGGLYSIRVSRESEGKNYCSKENGGVRNGNSSAGTLLDEGQKMAEDSLWAAVRSLEERILLLRQFADHLESNNRDVDTKVLLREIEKAERKADLVRQAVKSE